MNQRNYQRELEALLALPRTKGKTLLLHSCCAPCSSYVLEYLSGYFRITVFYYNPNITDAREYETRKEEQKRLVRELNAQGGSDIPVIEGDYEPQRFLELTRELQDCPEGGERCFLCYGLRLQKTARLAAERGFDYFASTLSISPLKHADKLNEIGERLSARYGVEHLPNDFKKKGGYQRSLELSAQFGLYRQNYCGCVYSKRDGGREEAPRDDNRRVLEKERM